MGSFLTLAAKTNQKNRSEMMKSISFSLTLKKFCKN